MFPGLKKKKEKQTRLRDSFGNFIDLENELK